MVLPTALWLRESVLWVALLSIYALVITVASAEQAAEASRHSLKMCPIERPDRDLNVQPRPSDLGRLLTLSRIGCKQDERDGLGIRP